MDLIGFLRARLDEDETAARASRSTLLIANLDRCAVPGSDERATFLHHERWEPRRVLAEIAAKRRIIDRCMPIVEMEGWEYTDAPDLAEAVLDALVQPYAKHPDFDPTWKATP